MSFTSVFGNARLVGDAASPTRRTATRVLSSSSFAQLVGARDADARGGVSSAAERSHRRRVPLTRREPFFEGWSGKDGVRARQEGAGLVKVVIGVAGLAERHRAHLLDRYR